MWSSRNVCCRHKERKQVACHVEPARGETSLYDNSNTCHAWTKSHHFMYDHVQLLNTQQPNPQPYVPFLVKKQKTKSECYVILRQFSASVLFLSLFVQDYTEITSLTWSNIKAQQHSCVIVGESGSGP